MARDQPRYHVTGEWLSMDTGRCTCGTGTVVGVGHPPGCGLEPIARVEDLLRDRQDAERARAGQETLPPFSGDTPECPKCGYAGGADVTYMATGHCIHDAGDSVLLLNGRGYERLHRSCRRCDYAWDEAVRPTPCPF